MTGIPADNNDRLKVLVVAYACNPYLGSEKGVGWGWVKAIARDHDPWVITAEMHRRDIEQAVAADPQAWRNVRFHYLPRVRWKRAENIWPPAYLWTYRRWLADAHTLAQQLHAEAGFDLAHQLTYVGYRVPGHLWKLDVPFVWGPIGGLENTPWRFLPALGVKGCIHYAARNVINALHKRFLPAPRHAFRKARGGIIAATEGIRREIRRWYGEESEVVCEIGPPEPAVPVPAARQPNEPVRIAWSGLHLPGKALPLLLKALARLPSHGDWELDILGTGPCTRTWRRLADKLGIEHRCRWHGWVRRDAALGTVREAHLFVITSVKELTSTVLLEALAQGVPVICPDHCGFSNVVTEDCGVKLPVVSPKQLQRDMAAAIAGLADDEGERRRLAAGALRRARDFSWEQKADAVDRLYRRVTGDACWNDREAPSPAAEISTRAVADT